MSDCKSHFTFTFWLPSKLRARDWKANFPPIGMGEETAKLNPLLIFMLWKCEFLVCTFYAKVSRSK